MNYEEWADIPGHEGVYKVSTHGRVMRVKAGPGCHAGKILRGDVSGKGYPRVSLYGGSRRNVHRLFIHQIVASVFIGPCPKGYQVNHIDGNKCNNYPSNLEYLTMQDNVSHARRTGLLDVRRERSPKAKLGESDVAKIRAMYQTGEWSQRKLARKFSVSQAQIGRIVRNESWQESQP